MRVRVRVRVHSTCWRVRSRTNAHKGVVTFIDTAGQEQYVEARREAIGSAQGFLLVYDVTQPYV